MDLWLPRANGKTRRMRYARCRAPPSSSRAEARILVCDDDRDVLTFVATVLRDNGHVVWEADAPSRALAILERERPLDLLLVDYAMPEMNGVTVIDRARTCQPELKVMLMSGHADVLRSGDALGIPLLAKPFKVAELRQRISEVLAMRPPDAGFSIPGAPHFAVSK